MIQKQAKFEGVDYWSRPVFKLIDSEVRIGSVVRLVGNNKELKEVKEYFKTNPDELVIFGTTFDMDFDPIGTPVKKGLIQIID